MAKPPAMTVAEAVQDELFTVEETAKFFGLTEQTIYRWIRAGHLGAIRLPGGAGWRVKASAIREVMDEEVSDGDQGPRDAR